MQTISVVGSTHSKWGQTFTRNNLYAVFELPVENGAAETGHELVSQLESIYLENPPKTQGETEALLASLSLPSESTVVIAIFSKDLIHIAGTGRGAAYIFRDREWATIFSDNTSVTGHLKENDRVFLCTPSLVQSVSEDEMARIAQSKSIIDIEEKVAELLHQSGTDDGASCLLLENKSIEHPAKQELVGSKPEQRTQDTAQKKSKKRAITAGIGGLLAILLVVSLFVGSHKRAEADREKQLALVLGAVSESIDEGSALVDINPSDAREKLVPAQQQLAEALDTFPEDSKQYQELVDKIAKTTDLIEKSQRRYEINEPELFIDLTWITNDAKGARMHKSDSALVTLDRENGSIYKTTLEKKNNDIFSTNDELTSAYDISGAQNQVYLLTDNQDKLIVNQKGDKVLESFDELGSPVALEAFGGNLYVLDTTKNILKLPRIEGGFGSPRPYLAEDVAIDFEDSVDFTIDGSIWVLTDDNILKFTLGAPDAYFIQDDVLTSAKALYTDSDSKLIYVLEDDRVVVFDKEGKYQEQYVWDGFKDATDIVVIDDKTILVLRSSKIYQLERIDP